MTLNLQENQVLALTLSSSWINAAINAARKLNIKDYYIAGGAVTQVVWNKLSNFPTHQGIKDIDIVYFDSAELPTQRLELQREFERLMDIEIPIDLTNQAFVHQWYSGVPGQQYAPFDRTEQGIDTWLPAFAIGIRMAKQGYSIYAPFGLDDLLSMTIRPNPHRITRDTYDRMVSNYLRRWPNVTAEEWDGADDVQRHTEGSTSESLVR